MLLTESIPPLAALPRQGAPLSPALTLLVARALMRDPRQRFATLGALREAFGELPRDVIAPPEQVVVALDRLARHALETRRQALSEVEERVSLSPQSVRTTARPPSPDGALPVVLPAGAFAGTEAPTKPRRKLTPVALPITEAVQPAGEALLLRESMNTGVSVIEDEPSPRTPARSSARRIAPFALIAVGVTIVLVALLARFGPSGISSTNPLSTTAELVDSGGVPAPVPSTPSDVEQPEPAAPASGARVPVPSASASAVPSRDRDRPQEVRRKDAGGYRPKGI